MRLCSPWLPLRGIFSNMSLTWPKIASIDLRVHASERNVPIYFLEVRHNHEVPAALAERYLQQLTAPRKELIWFARSAHVVDTEEADKFNRFFVERWVQETRPPFKAP
jgi:esterase/lipase